MPLGYLRCCPRCRGDVFVEQDIFGGTSLSCLQCGHVLTAAEEQTLLDRVHRARSVA
ncbi:MAG: hypothetical protein HYU88_08185 [Chloroflexi bacterium]|nr:hypothetical protein [Chloroflexota bacterium]MBI4504865.1 hypothetical protein [Chloroflexota bacterium]